jgi:G3E family GTPase
VAHDSSGDDPRTPVVILTGFLGSGKTTLLNQILRHPDMAHTAVVINEFGDVSIDHALTSASDDAILVLDNGCLCCTVFGDLIQTLNRLYHARAGGSIGFDRVAIETSGLADLPTILQAFLSDPTLAGLYRVSNVIATVDAINGPDTLTEHAVARRQVALADLLLITKLDLLGAAQREAAHSALHSRLQSLAPAAQVHTAADPQFNVVHMLRDAGADPGRSPEAAKAWLDRAVGAAAPQPGHVPAGHLQHAHVHSDAIHSFSLVRETPVPREALSLLLSSLERHLGPSLLRVKGLVHVAEEPQRPAIIQGAQHLLHNLDWLPHWPDADRRTRIVFITHGIAPEELQDTVELLDRVAQRTAAARQRAAAQAGGASNQQPI